MDKKRVDAVCTIAAIAVFIACVAFAIGALAGKAAGKGEIRREAVREGVAHWVASEKGYSEFQWITPDKEGE